MFKLRLKMLTHNGRHDLAEAHLEGAWRALSAVIGERDAAIMILRNIYKDQWEYTPKGMVTFIMENFDARYSDIVPGEHRKQADV